MKFNIEPDQIREVITMLNKQAEKLRRSSILVVCSTGINIAVGIIVLSAFIWAEQYSSGVPKVALFLADVCAAIPALFYIYQFDQKKKRGDIVFEEASNYFDWAISKGELRNTLNDKEKQVFFKLRISFREYSRSCDLPFMPGKRGIAGYTMLNVLIVMFIGFSLITIHM